MKRSRYKETIDLAWSKDTFTLKGKKGTRIYKEERDNHIPNMRRITNEGEFPLPRYDYLVFELKEKVSGDILKNISYHHGVTLRNTEYGTEIACHHPQVFHNSLLSNLIQQGYVNRTWKQSSKEEREYPYFVNPNAWQLLYNISSLLVQGLHKSYYYFYRKIRKLEVEGIEN